LTHNENNTTLIPALSERYDMLRYVFLIKI
jgi:hypothetical protein